MKYWQPIIRFLLKLFLIGSSQLFYVPIVCAQDSSSLSEEDREKHVSSQSWQEYLMELSEMEDFEQTAWEDYEEELEELAQHPLNLNTATREEMEHLPFLTPSQVEDVQAYLHRYHGMKTMAELALIPSISWYQRQLMNSFFYIADETPRQQFPSLKNILKYGKHEVMGMVKVPFYERKGDGKGTDGYLGYKYRHGVRYQFRYGDYVKMGVVGAQDAGEPFGAGKNSLGYDFYSFYIQLKKLGRWKNITLGRYRLHEGLGLILNNDFSFGKFSILSSFGRTMPSTIRVHSSRSSANYLQGAAATYSLMKGLDITGFVSYRKIDATLASKGGIKTILKTGLHRTYSEIAKQDVASNTLVGGNINYHHAGWHAGATAFYTSFSLPLTPNTSQLYKRFSPVGDQFWNASIDYGYISHRWNIAGETATGDCGAIATLNTISYQFTDRFLLMALQRFYSARYYSLFSNSFSEGSAIQDENGVYLGVTWTPASRWNITAYSDFAYFVWPKYQTRESTQSWDNLVSVIFQASRCLALGGRIRYKDKAGTTTGRLRLYANLKTAKWFAKTSMDFAVNREASLMENEKGTISRGYMLNENLGTTWRWLRLSGRFSYFHTQDYSSRIYVYEPGLLYQMSFGSYYGEGIRYALVARSEISHHLLVIAKLGCTNYFDRNHISSGKQEIAGSRQMDLEVQVKWKW